MGCIYGVRIQLLNAFLVLSDILGFRRIRGSFVPLNGSFCAMKIPLTICLVFGLFSTASVSGQEPTQTVRGLVLDKESRELVHGAEVTLFGATDTLQTQTDSAGEF